MPTKTRIGGINYTQLPRMVSDDIILYGIPQTSGAPQNYGDLADVINQLYSERKPEKIVYAHNFGVVYDAFDVSPTDNKSAIEAAIAEAGLYGAVVFSGAAATSPINVSRTVSNGLLLIGSGGISDLNFTNATPAICAFGDQTHILSIGDNSNTVEGMQLRNIVIHGLDKQISVAGLHIVRWSQGVTDNLVVTNCKGLGVKVQKWEDCENNSIRVLKCGTVAGKEGGLQFSDSPDLPSNVIKFFGGRFEWIDGPFVSMDAALSTAAVSHVTFINTKFEIAERDGYGTTRTTNPLWDFRASTFDKCQNIQFLGCWASQSQNCLELLRLGRSHGVYVKDLKMSSTTGGPVRLFTLSESGGTDARDFQWLGTSIINTSGNYGSFTIDVQSNNINTMTFERPMEYQTNGSRLSSNMGAVLNSNVIGIDGQIAVNPNHVTDPCLTPSKTVCARAGSSNSAIAWLGSARYDKDGVVYGFSGNLNKGLYEVRIRCKKGGNAANARIEIRGSAFLGQVDLDSTSYEWKSIWVNTRAATGTMAITLSTFNQADHTIYIDAVEIIPTKEIFAAAIPVSGAYLAGERVWFTAPSAGTAPGAVCVTGGSPGTWKNMPALAV
jgi:hypothetical protein